MARLPPPFYRHVDRVQLAISKSVSLQESGLAELQVKTLSAGISKMSREDIEVWYDDDVLTGEIMVSRHCL